VRQFGYSQELNRDTRSKKHKIFLYDLMRLGSTDWFLIILRIISSIFVPSATLSKCICLQPTVYACSRITYTVLLFRCVCLNEVTTHENQCLCSVHVLMYVTSLTSVGDAAVYVFRFFCHCLSKNIL